MYVIRDKKFCYLAQPRTGSRAIRKTLLEKLNAEQVAQHHTTWLDVPENRKFSWAWPSVTPNTSWVIVSTVRNHFDAVVSWFTSTHRGPLSLRQYWEQHVKDQDHEYLKPHQLYWRYRPLSNRILRYESLQQDWDKVLESIGLPPTKIEHVNNPQAWRYGAKYRDLISPDLRFEIQAYYSEEMAELGYEW